MEAVAYRQQAERCNNELIVGKLYQLKKVGFCIAEFAPPFGLFVPTDYYVHIDSRSEIRPSNPHVRMGLRSPRSSAVNS